MKKISVIMMALALSVSVFSFADAGNKKGGCGDCVQKGQPSEQVRKFQADTIDLRQEMMIKRFDVQREKFKGVPDREKIAALQADIKALQAKIMDIRSKSGLPTDKCDGECTPTLGDCGKMKGDCNGPCGGSK